MKHLNDIASRKQPMKQLYLGLDGGGTKTRAVAVTRDGVCVRSVEGPGLNYLQDTLPVCLDRFETMIRELLGDADPASACVCAGLAALDGPAEPAVLEAFRSRLPAGCDLILLSDAAIALTGMAGGNPGLMIICGTGSMLTAMSGSGENYVLGGWGWKLHDTGSGYTLARKGLIRALETYDLEGCMSPLLTAALSFFAVAQPREILNKLYDPAFSPDQLAAFGAEVLRLADAGEAEALSILRGEMQSLAHYAARLCQMAPDVRCGALYGGVFQHSPLAVSLFHSAFSPLCPLVRITEPLHTPPVGAVISAMLQDGFSQETLPDFTWDLKTSVPFDSKEHDR